LPREFIIVLIIVSAAVFVCASSGEEEEGGSFVGGTPRRIRGFLLERGKKAALIIPPLALNSTCREGNEDFSQPRNGH